jgi:hypothetical protein
LMASMLAQSRWSWLWESQQNSLTGDHFVLWGK